jgi:hypothetical protein
MEAKELRIGNYCKEITHSTNGVVKVSKRHFEDIEDGEIDLFPIPLTEDWLVKFCFIKGEDSYSFRGFFLENRNTDPFLPQLKREKLKDSFGVWRNNNFLTNIKHVNQLQNLYFALTNQELTIKN